METNTQNDGRHFDLTSFVKAKDKMIATNDNAYRTRAGTSVRESYDRRFRNYTEEEIADIISSGSLVEQQNLSRHFFNIDGYYKHIIIHYATFLKYMGLLIPNPSAGKSLSTSHIQKRYFSAMELVEAM